MSKYIIEGGRTLDGKIEIKGAKNSVLPLLAACILTEEKMTILDCPDISDVRNMLRILEYLGCKTNFDKGAVTVDSSGIRCGEIPSGLAKELRSSIFLLGALLSRLNTAKIAYPGGCDIGIRPIDIHLGGLRELNVDIVEQFGYILCNSCEARSADIVLDLPSVGATENLIMASVFLDGETVIRNCAKEPEIVDLQNMLNRMGAKVRGAGSGVVSVTGVRRLRGAVWRPIPDRIVAGTYLIAAAMCGGELELRNACPAHISSLIAKLSKTACKITCGNDKILVRSSGRLNSLSRIETMYYPGFPTDLQTQMLALQSVSRGTCMVVENIFETRFKPVVELRKMGADIDVRDKVAIVRGVNHLEGSEVLACDLRGGASLVLAGLAAHGITAVKDIYHIDRGYEDMARDLSAVGANIKRTEDY